MISRTIVLNAIEPALLSVRSALGVALDMALTFINQNGTPADAVALMPQLALLPRSRAMVMPYDLVAAPAGKATVSVPGTALVDPAGYTLELYQRRSAAAPGDPPVAVGLLAKGVLRLEGSAYTSYGPLGMVNVPVVTGPAGPQGAPGVGVQGEQGEEGQRGSQWSFGIGAPSTPPPIGTLAGDMYLDEMSGDVWQYNGVDWVATAP